MVSEETCITLLTVCKEKFREKIGWDFGYRYDLEKGEVIFVIFGVNEIREDVTSFVHYSIYDEGEGLVEAVHQRLYDIIGVRKNV